MVPSKTFDADATLAAMTQQSATALVATEDEAAAISAALAADALRPAAKRRFNISTLRSGVVGEHASIAATKHIVQSRKGFMYMNQYTNLVAFHASFGRCSRRSWEESYRRPSYFA